MGRRNSYEDYWDMFWLTGMPEAFGVYRITKELNERMEDMDGFEIHDDPPHASDARPL